MTLRATFPPPLNATASATAPPVREKFLEAASFVAEAALPVQAAAEVAVVALP